MIEYRAVLRKNKRFEGGFKPDAGTYVYAQETRSGWIGTYYTDRGSAHSFALADEDFAILQSADCQVEYLVVMPDPPTPPKKVQEKRELARRRLEAQIARHGKAARELEKLLREQE